MIFLLRDCVPLSFCTQRDATACSGGVTQRGGGMSRQRTAAVIVHLYVSGEMVSDIIQHHDVRDKKGNPILSTRNSRRTHMAQRYAAARGGAACLWQ